MANYSVKNHDDLERRLEAAEERRAKKKRRRMKVSGRRIFKLREIMSKKQT